MSLPTVYMITWCQSVAEIETAMLTFKTLRVGFPSSPIVVIDNNSFPAAHQRFKQAAQGIGAMFFPLQQKTRHFTIIEQILQRQDKGRAVLVDPDMCFWEKIEDWEFESLMAGRLLPRFRDPVYGCITEPRLHTSLFWINDVERVKRLIGGIMSKYPDFSPFRQAMVRMREEWHWYDTGASLYSASPESHFAFGETQLNAYDHLFCGTHATFVRSHAIDQQFIELFNRSHREALTNPDALKHAWRWQEEYFRSLAMP